MSGVLSGVRIVELASWTYVPSAGAALSDWGADVIKVEGVASGDPGRTLVVGGFTRDEASHLQHALCEPGNWMHTFEVGQRGCGFDTWDVNDRRGRKKQLGEQQRGSYCRRYEPGLP